MYTFYGLAYALQISTALVVSEYNPYRQVLPKENEHWASLILKFGRSWEFDVVSTHFSRLTGSHRDNFETVGTSSLTARPHFFKKHIQESVCEYSANTSPDRLKSLLSLDLHFAASLKTWFRSQKWLRLLLLGVVKQG